MILTDIRLENYRQYAGVHEISIRDSGMVAIIGANGAGKTTLFEAIEWCLYKPTRIQRNSVLSRDTTGATRVTVRMEDPATGNRYVVDRRMIRSGNVEATVYLEHQPENRLATGTGDVTTYVARHLIGLNHSAFLATFFTRQKELSFFGNLGATERRREVAALLGHDAIVNAAGAVAEDAKVAANAADVSRQMHQRESEGRDFEAELVAATERIAAAEQAFDEAVISSRDASRSLAAITAEVDRLREIERQHSTLTNRISQIDGDHRVAVERQGAARGRIAAIDAEAAQRPAVATIAALEPERRTAVAAHQQERERESERRNLSRELEAVATAEQRLAGDLRQTVTSSGTEDMAAGWAVAREIGDPASEVARLLLILDALPIAEAETRDRALRHVQDAIAIRQQASQQEARLRQQLAQAIRERDALSPDGDPQGALSAVRADLEQLRQEYSDRKSLRDKLADERKAFASRIENLEKADFSKGCQTCFRPFTAADAAETLELYRSQVERLNPQIAEMTAHVNQVEARGKQLGAEEARLTGVLQRLGEAIGRVSSITAEHRQAQEHLDAAQQHVANALNAAGVDAEPDADAIRTASEYAAALGRIASVRQTLARILRDARSCEADRARLTSALDLLGPSRYDQQAHHAAEAALQESRDATVRLQGIDARLAERPFFEQQVRDAVAAADAALNAKQDLEHERLALGHDPARMIAADQEAARSNAAETAARTAEHFAETSMQNERAIREAVRDAQRRVVDLAEEANRRQREADDLSLMKDGFREFEKYVSSRVNPILSERTAEFLTLVTAGAYQQVEFDTDYGLMVYDDDRPFPITEFSGGERDVAALCARLALSTVIGDQAVHPPGFVVLDEVFGSLDQERRALVLETLRDLTGSDQTLRQLFVISHVEEVNASPLVDEVWRITAPNGVSKLEQDPRDGTITQEQAEQLLIGDE